MLGIFAKKGVKLKEKKITENNPITQIKIPEKLFVHLSQHIGKPCNPIVKIGDNVKKFQKIADSNEFISAPIHSPINGKIIDIKKYPHPNGKEESTIIIEKIEGNVEPIKLIKKNISDLSKKELIKKIRDAGVVGLGGAMFPTHVKLSIPKGKKIHTLIINGAECEPFLTADSRLMIEKSKEINEGIKIIKNIVGAKKVIIGIEENKQHAIKVMRENTNFKVLKLKSVYPRGAEKIIIKKITKQFVPSGKLPLDIGIVVTNVSSCFSVFEAVYYDKPLVERIITVSGDVNNPNNFLTPLGTRFIDLIKESGGYKGTPKKIICGGPMMGLTQFTDEVSTIKGNNGIIVFNKKNPEIKQFEEQDCIRCGKCIDVCPVNLAPTTIVKYVKKEKYGFAKLHHAKECYECGCCSYICPSKINLTHWIKIGKNEIK